MSLTALMSIGALVANAASEAVEDPEWKKKLAMLGKGLGAGLTIGGAATKFANKSLGTDPKISKGITSEADSITDIFKPPYSSGGLANSLQIGDPTQPGLFKPIEPMYGIGAGWGM